MSKKKSEEASENFIKIPNSYPMLRSKNVGADEIMLLGLIGNLSMEMDCIAKNEYLAIRMNVSERTIRRYLANLQKDNLIKIEQNNKAKSHRTIFKNHDAINEKCQYGGQGCPCEETEIKSDGEGVDKVVHIGGQGCPSGWTDVSMRVDSSGFENAENTNNSLDNSNLIEKIIDKKIEKRKEKIHTASQYTTSADADGETAPQSEGAPHLKEKYVPSLNNKVLPIMRTLNMRFDLISGWLSDDRWSEKLLSITIEKYEEAIKEGYKILKDDDLVNYIKEKYLN